MRFAFIVCALMFIGCLSAEVKRFYNAGDIYGLTVTEPNSVCKDENGFIWIASKEGILRLADNGSKMYSLPYSSFNVTSVEIVQRSNRVAAFTNQGEIFLYNAVADRFENILNLPEKIGKSTVYLSQVEFDNDGGLWIASSSGLFHAVDNRLTQVKGIDDALGDITFNDRGELLAGGPGGIYAVSPLTMKADRICEVENIFPTLIRCDALNDRIWVGTMSSGLYFVDMATGRLSRAEAPDFPRQYVRDIEMLSDSIIWCGIDGRGIYELSRDGKHVRHIYREDSDAPYSVAGNGIQDMCYEAPDRMWVCSFTGGVSIADMGPAQATLHTHRPFLPKNSLVNNYIYCLTEDASGQLWIGTNSGLSCWNPGDNTWTNFFDNMGEKESFIIPSVCNDDDGNIWVGTYSHGAYVIDSETKKIKANHTSNDGILSKNGFVFDITKDRYGNIWLAGMIGDILKYDRKKKTFENYPSIPAQSMAELNDSTILVLSSNRLLSLNKNTKEYTTLLSDNIIRDMAVVSDTIWLATSGRGLLSYNTATGDTYAYGTHQGFLSDRIKSLVHNAGKLWLGTDKGLLLFDIQAKTMSKCKSSALIGGNNFTPHAATRLSSGRSAWGTTKGLLVVSGESDIAENPAGRIYISDILLSGQSIREHPELKPDVPVDSLTAITLDYKNSDISFEVLSLGTMSYSPAFSYKIEEVDDHWTGPGDYKTISYANLTPGDYKLRIRMHNPAVVTERIIEIHITPPFWETWWFRTIILCVIAAAVIAAFRTYVNRLNRKNAESKLQFFVTTAHDLRTSLTLIKAPIEQLRDSGSLSASDYEYVNLASTNVDHLTSLTTKLIDFQRIDIGKVQPHFVRRDIVEFVQERIAMFSSFAEKKSVKIVFNTDAYSYYTAIDVGQMAQIIDNLISNAIKYSYPESTIEVCVSCSTECWVLKVIDHGIGIVKKDRKRLFREFYRGQNAIAANISGSGIGLALVKRLVEIHGGTIHMQSQENVGSTFEVTIPCRKWTEATAEEADVTSSTREEEEEMRILIAEDNDDLREFMRRTLGKNFKVSAVSDGEKAWEVAKATIPDLIVSDIIMPVMDGFELCRLVKSTFETSHIPVILLSALTEQTDEIHGIGLGADEYLTKPFNTKTLATRIASVIRTRRILGERLVSRITSEDGKERKPDANPLNDAFVAKALDVIIDNLDNSDFGKDEFAKAMGVSTSLLFRKIKALSGLSIVDFIKKVRMEHAMKLLDDPSLSISDIAFKCGFSSIGYFSTVFKKYFGKTPSECRKF